MCEKCSGTGKVSSLLRSRLSSAYLPMFVSLLRRCLTPWLSAQPDAPLTARYNLKHEKIGELWDPKDLCQGCKGKKVLTEVKILEVCLFCHCQSFLLSLQDPYIVNPCHSALSQAHITLPPLHFPQVNVDKGMRDGQKITFRGEGDQEPGVEPGDIVLVLKARDHPKFQRHGNDLVMKKTITLTEALCGFKVGAMKRVERLRMVHTVRLVGRDRHSHTTELLTETSGQRFSERLNSCFPKFTIFPTTPHHSYSSLMWSTWTAATLLSPACLARSSSLTPSRWSRARASPSTAAFLTRATFTLCTSFSVLAAMLHCEHDGGFF